MLSYKGYTRWKHDSTVGVWIQLGDSDISSEEKGNPLFPSHVVPRLYIEYIYIYNFREIQGV